MRWSRSRGLNCSGVTSACRRRGGLVSSFWPCSQFSSWSARVGPMPRQPRSPRAVLVKGGRWIRPPRPRRLIARSRSPPRIEPIREEGSKQGQDNDDNAAGYVTCDEQVVGDVANALVASAQPVIRILAGTDAVAAEIVQALCDRLLKREEQVGRYRARFREARVHRKEAEAKLGAQEDLQGQSARHWWQVQRLRGQLDHAKFKNSGLRREVWDLKHHRLVP